MELENQQHLLEAVRSGDKEAFKDLVHPLIARAYRTALAIVRSSHLAEEAVQNSLIELYKTIIAGKEIHNLHGWFSRLIANRSLDLLRHESRFNKGLDIDNVEIEDKAGSPIEQLVNKERSDQVFEAILSLETEQRAIVMLYYYQEMKIEEISSLLNVKAGTVKTRLYRARMNLVRKLHVPLLNAKVVEI
jgi:RNA polymerase sigma factor (sigma-70 family)